MKNHSIIDPRDYRSFCMRGQGRCNFVISAKGKNDGLRIVWRIAKHRKTGTVNVNPKCQVLNNYLENFVTPFLGDSHLLKPKIVQIPCDLMHYIAKIPSLPYNLKIENFDQLFDKSKFTSQMSFFNNNVWKGLKFVSVLEMPDATRIPRQLSFVYGPTITLEIKPKQGFFQQHPGINVPFCNNCILQMEKWKTAAFERMYDFCPLQLYSGDKSKMDSALFSLIYDPHRNLRIFVDGSVVHDEGQQVSLDDLTKLLFPCVNEGISSFISAISCILAGVSDDQDENFHIQSGSVLDILLRAQKTDNIGIVQAYNYFKLLPISIQKQLRTKSNLIDNCADLSFLKRNDYRSLIEQYLLAATMKDCSLMISLRLIDKIGSCGTTVVRVKGSNDNKLYFAYSIRIVDLDPKSAKNLENAYKRFMSGIEFIYNSPGIRSPCINTIH